MGTNAQPPEQRTEAVVPPDVTESAPDFTQYCCFSDGNAGTGLSPQDHANAVATLDRNFGNFALVDASGNPVQDVDGDGVRDPSYDFNRDGKADMSLLANGMLDVNGDGTGDINLNALSKQLNANPQDVATLVAFSRMALEGGQPTPAQQQAALDAARAICGFADGVVERGDAGALAGALGRLNAAYSALGGAGVKGFFMKGDVEASTARITAAMKDVLANPTGDVASRVHARRRT